MAVVHRADEALGQRRFRRALIAFGLLNAALAAVGVMVSGIPTGLFTLISLWAFLKSVDHTPHWFPVRRRKATRRSRAGTGRLSRRAVRALALCSVSVGLAIGALFFAARWAVPLAVAAAAAPAATFFLSRPDGPQEPDPTPG